MQKWLLIALLLIVIQTVAGAQDPAPFFCETQGYSAINSFVIDYNGKDVRLASDTSQGSTIFMLYFKEEGVKSHPYNPITEIYDLSEDEKDIFIENIKNERDFGDYKVERVTTEGYEGYLIEGKYEVSVYCNYPEGYSCPWEDFRDKKCGVQYLKEIPCVKEGGYIRTSFQECCQGLEVYNPTPECEGCLPICQKISNDKEPVQEEPDKEPIEEDSEEIPVEEEGDKEEIPVEVKDKEEMKLDNDLLFYFYSERCPHCSGMDEELNKVKKELDIEIIKVNVIRDSDLAQKYNIRAIPSLVFIKEDGSYIKREGKTDYLAIIEWIKSSVNVAFEETQESEEKIPIEEKVYEIPAEEEPEREVTYFCNGCLKNNKCYPLGYRKSGEYCSDNEQFVNQLEGGKSCDNNFECNSNVCVDGECISGGLLRQILDWLRSLFGIK